MAARKCRTASARSRTATHRPATRRRRFRLNDLVAVDQVDGFGNTVSPPVGTWVGTRLRASLDIAEAIA
ncbi:hypothetical protein AB0878_04365 [Amycolatopsis sp. NPDC047767]|uniref:hypothetical protein n=1 Tax=Amycolatopsis sp. NPDC047767 TaxID=3156765 RepID=UPI0034573A04